MENKKLVHILKLKVPAQKAIANQSINTALGQYGININSFLENCNEITKSIPQDLLVNILVYLYENRTFKIQIKGLILTTLISDFLIETSQIENKEILKSDLVFILLLYKKFSSDSSNLKYLSLNKSYFISNLNILCGILKSMRIKIV